MLDIGASEILLTAIVAIVVIGPKDLPVAMRTAGRWIGKMRRVSGHLRAGIDTMVREAEMEEMEKKWREQNEAIMKANPTAEPYQAPQSAEEPATLQSATDAAGNIAPVSAEAAVLRAQERAREEAQARADKAAAASYARNSEQSLDEILSADANSSPTPSTGVEPSRAPNLPHS